MNSDFFASPIISQILTWIFSIPIVLCMLEVAVTMLFKKQEGIPRIYTLWLIICLILFSPLRYILLQLLVAIAFPFQSFTAFLSTFLLAIYIPIVFGLLYAIGLILPLFLTVLIVGVQNPPPKGRLFLSGIVGPLIFFVFSTVYYTLLPYAAYSTHWIGPKELIRSTNGPPYYFYRYAVEQFTPLQFSGFTHDIVLENLDAKERFRAHVAAVYCGNKQHWYYVSKAYPVYFERMEQKYEKGQH